LNFSDTQLWHRAQDCIGQYALTNSKNPFSHVFGVYPKYVKAASGVTLSFADGRSYIDYCGGLGTNILGYANQQLKHFIYANADMLGSHSFPTYLEVECAEKLKELFPYFSHVKFVKTGTEACMAAIKIARASTGRMKVLSDGYHGWSDPFVSLSEPAAGVPKGQFVYQMNGPEDIDLQTACVIVEPVLCEDSPQRRKYLEQLRAQCDKAGALLIYDEIITGFRFLNYSVGRCYNIQPDLVCVGKAMGNGAPISAVLGQKETMNNMSYFVSGTFCGETYGLLSAIKTMEILQKDHRFSIPDLWESGKRFQDRFNAIMPSIIQIKGYPTRGAFHGSERDIALFFQESARAGILFGRSFFYTSLHDKHDDIVLNTCNTILTKIIHKEVKLDGAMPIKPFALAQRERARG
jgi:glutamate-1-semialdehyde 2,1-aminomutase